MYFGICQYPMLGLKVRKLVSFIKGEKIKRNKSSVTKANKKVNGGKELVLPENILNKIFDSSSPYDVARWRSVNKKFNEVITKRYDTILYLDVWRMDLNELLPKRVDNDGKIQLIVEQNPETEAEFQLFRRSNSFTENDNKIRDFFRHRTAQLLMHVEAHSAIIVINNEWTSKDVVKLWQAMQAFRKCAQTVMLDASVFELTMAGLALRDISRWFSYMCSLSMVVDEEDKPVLKTKPGKFASEPFFPRVKELTIRTTYPELKQLRRVPEYGAPTNHLFNPETIQLLRLNIANAKQTGSPQNARYTRYLVLFKRWLKSGELAEKYCQQYS